MTSNLMQEFLLSEVTKIKKACEEGMRIKENSHPICNNVFLKKVLETDKNSLSQIFGKFGKKLKHFSEFYDVEHPHMNHIISSIAGEKIELELIESIDIAETVINNKMNALIGLISNLVCSSPLIKKIMELFDTAPIRMIKEISDRECVRVVGSNNINLENGERILKAPSDIMLFKLINLSNNDWVSACNSFENYVRFCNIEADQIAKYSCWSERLANMGIVYQANTYRKRSEEFEKRIKNNYCGFYKININEASAILGRVHNYRNKSPFSKIVLDPEDPKIDILFQLMISSDNLVSFVNEFFDSEREWDKQMSIAENISKITGKIDIANDIALFYESMTNENGVNLFEYQPRLYPLHAFQTLIPERTKQMIDQLESFDDFGGKPLFDKFYVLVPGVVFNEIYFQNDLTDEYQFKSKEKIIKLKKQDEAFFLMDSYLIKYNSVYPIVLGKKDNEFYFLNYWDV